MCVSNDAMHSVDHKPPRCLRHSRTRVSARARALPPPTDFAPPSPSPCSHRPPVRKVRRQVCDLRLVRATDDARARVRRVQLRLVLRALRHLRRAGQRRRLLLQGVHAARKGRAWRARAWRLLLLLLLLFIIAARVSPPRLGSLSPEHAQRDGCPKVINVGAARAALYYESKKYAFTKKS